MQKAGREHFASFLHHLGVLFGPFSRRLQMRTLTEPCGCSLWGVVLSSELITHPQREQRRSYEVLNNATDLFMKMLIMSASIIAMFTLVRNGHRISEVNSALWWMD